MNFNELLLAQIYMLVYFTCECETFSSSSNFEKGETRLAAHKLLNIKQCPRLADLFLRFGSCADPSPARPGLSGRGQSQGRLPGERLAQA